MGVTIEDDVFADHPVYSQMQIILDHQLTEE